MNKGIWKLDEVNNEKREDAIRNTLQKLIIYLIFFIITSIVVLAMVPPLLFTFTNVLKAQFVELEFSTTNDASISFPQIQTATDFWEFLESVVAKHLYKDYWYDSEKPIMNTTDDDKKILYENKLLGVPRLRQLRVRNDSCKIHENFQRTFYACYSGYTKAAEDQYDFGPGNSEAWKYHSHQKLKGMLYWGQVATYDGGGFYQDLSLEKSETQDILKNLKENLWITRNTRVIFLDFTLYNGNLNLFCVIKFVFEFPPTGGVLPTSNFHGVKLIRYVTKQDFFVLGCEIIFVCFILYYTIEEVLEIKYFKWQYIQFFWNYIDLTIVFISYFCIGFSIYRFLYVYKQIDELQENPKIYCSFEYVGYWQTHYNNALAITLFILWLKIFKHMNLSRAMGQLNSTLSRCAADIISFSIMFFIVFLAFAQVGYLLFGSQVEHFSTFGNSLMTLLITILGEFDYYEIEKTNKVLAPIFFTAYIFFVFFVLFNMFLAIITDTYSDVKNENDTKKSELEIIDFVERAPRNILRKCKKPVKKEQKLPGNEIIDNLRKILKICKFSDLEIEVFLSEYDIDDQKEITDADIKTCIAKLENRKYEPKTSPNAMNKQTVTLDVLVSQQKQLEELDIQLQLLRRDVDKLLTEITGSRSVSNI